MSKINFEPIAEAMKLFDTDTIDVYRKEDIENDDGTSGEEYLKEALYKDVACHISFNSIDNPNENAIDSEPIITVITINCSLDVDLQKGDYIVAKKLANDGTVLETYKGVIGFSEVTQSRKSAQMEMRTDV